MNVYMNRYQASSEHHPSITYLPLLKISHNVFSHHRTDMCNFTRLQDKGQREQLPDRGSFSIEPRAHGLPKAWKPSPFQAQICTYKCRRNKTRETPVYSTRNICSRQQRELSKISRFAPNSAFDGPNGPV